MSTVESQEQETPVPPAPAGGPGSDLSVDGVAKTYGPVHALRPLSLELRAGEVHALVGENGSGKSTLVGIVSGAVRPDQGTVRIGGVPLRRFAPWESQRAGVLTVFQDGTLIADLSVAHNLYLGTPRGQRPSFGRVDSWAAERLARYGLTRLDPGEPARALPPGDAQLLDIVRALTANPRILLLDEATSSLDAPGVDVALDLMRKAADQGTAVLFVTHRLSEVFRVADRISVLRDGQYQGTSATAAVTSQQLVQRMAGTDVTVEFPRRAAPGELGEEVLVARGLRGTTYGPVDLTVRRGEVVGLAGADGNGQLGLLQALSAVGLASGSLVIGGTRIGGFEAARKAGVAYLSSDRRQESLFPSLSIRENLVAGVLKNLSHLGYLGFRREGEQAEGSVGTFGIRLGSTADPVTSLSGGNQQKVALSRVLVTRPDVLLVDEPTKGVDVRSRIDIYHLLRSATREGRAVVVLSSDAAELAGLCDRVVVLSRGTAVAEIQGEVATEERIIGAFTVAGQEAPGGEGAGQEGAGGDPAHPEAAGREAGAAGRAVHHRRRSRRFSQDSLRLGLVILVLLAIGGYTQSQASSFLSSASINNVLLLTLPLAVVAGAEFLVMFSGTIDVSIGATMGLTVAVLSFLFASQGTVAGLLLCLLLSLGIGIAVGAANAFIVEKLRIPAVIATIATLGILQGLGLTLRPTPGGTINAAVISALTTSVGPVPVPLIVVVAVFVLCDVLLRSTGRGLRLRAVGLDAVLAFRLGENTPRQRQLAYVGCAVLASVAGILLAVQVGVGDSTVGNQFTLLAVAAPILGGASLLGGRGSFVGCLVGALLLALSEALPSVLNLSNGLSYVLAGALTLVAILVYTGAAWQVTAEVVREAALRRRIRRAGAGTTPAPGAG
ncbi:MAG: ATP-binding cassette domain-containing protein [Acidimicrobiales bacterium]